MSYKFHADPKVVESRSKYRSTQPAQDEQYGTPTKIHNDNRIKILSPSEQEEEYVRIEKERMKVENMHKQLSAFKANKKKTSPYDIKPSPKPKVNVNLEFFLTDSTDIKPPQTDTDIQTDVFKEKPRTPVYVPKKTGRDVYTQVEDNELFNFDREVTPIIDVIITKTLEQSVIEIEEEEEIRKIKQFKEGFARRRHEDEQKWRAMLQKELETIATKDKKLEEYRIREEKRIRVLRKLQAYQVAHNYLRDLGKNTFTYLHENGLYQNNEKEELVNKVPGILVEGVIKTLSSKQKIEEQLVTVFGQIAGDLKAMRGNADKKFKARKEKKRVKRINHSKEERLVRLVYQDENTPSAHFVRFMAKFQEADLAAFFEDYRTRSNQLKERLQKEEINQEEFANTNASEFPEMQTPTHFRTLLNDLKVLSFNVANNKYYAQLHKNGFLDISVSSFNKEGHFLYQIDSTNKRNSSKSINYLGNIRDSTLKISDDLGIKINLGKVEPEVSHLVFTVEIKNLEQSIAILNDSLTYSRFRVADYITDQTVEATDIFPNFKLDELKDPSAESELGGKILCYYLNRSPEHGWILESVKTYKNVPVETYSEFNKTIENYLKACVEEELKQVPGTPEEMSPEQSFDKGKPTKNAKDAKETKDAKDVKGKKSNVPSQIIETKKEEEEEAPPAKFNTSNFGPLHLKVSDSLEEIKAKIDAVLQKEHPELYKSFEYGYEILVEGKEMVRSTQVKKIAGFGSFAVVRKPKPFEEILQTTEEEQADGDNKSDADD